MMLLVIFVLGTGSASDIGFPQISGPPNFIYHNFTHCALGKTPININITGRWLNKTYQVLDGDAYTPVPVGDNLLVKVAIYTLVLNKWMHLTNVSAKACQLFRNYIGPPRKVLMSAIGLPEDTCPIPKGLYHARGVNFNMKNSRIPAFPYGEFRLRFAVNNVVNDALQLCLIMALENKPT